MKGLFAAGALAAMAVCLASPFLYLWRLVSEQQYEALLFTASIAWFVFATAWATRGSRPTS